MASEVGLKIDNRYEVQAELGRGGMGVVYKAMDIELERLVAIKVMTSHVADNPEYVSRFDAEARTAAKMQHPNIAVVYARGRHAGAPYIAMEFCEGTPLDRLINSGAQFSLLQKIDYIIQVCNALHYAHTEWKVVHRDVKPANIMVMKDGHRVKLLDFGIARAGLSTATKSGTAIGTTFYMSPQQIRGEKGLDGRSDIFSVGVVLYELITNNVPWTGESDFQVLAKIVNDPYPPLSAYLPAYPPALDRVLTRALAKDLTSRYQTAEEMAVELADLQTPLKEEIIEEAYAARDGGDLLRANELATQVLRLDTRHGRALALHNELQPQLQKKTERLRELKEEAEQAVGKREFDKAISAISEAIAINPTNAELHDLRKAIEQERERKKFVFNRLKLAQAAKEMSDIGAANKLIDEALEKDPTDTQARMMKTVLARMAEDEKKKRRLEALVEEIRGFIAGRRFSEAYTSLRAMEELDPNFAELATLKAAARDAYAKEERRKELDSAIREVKKVLAEGNSQRALAATEQALQKFPEDSTLLKCREQAEGMRVAAERQEALKKEIAAAWELNGKKQSADAVRLLEQALQRYGADSQLRTALEQLRGSAERERVARAEQELLEKARQAMHVEDFESAARMLRAGRIDYPSSSEIKQALAVAEEGMRRITDANKTRQREAIEILEALLASELHPEAQVRIVEDALRRNPGNERIEQLATVIRDRHQRVAPVVQRAQDFESAGQYTEAIREWQRVREIYAQYPQADKNIERLNQLANPAPPTTTAIPAPVIPPSTGPTAAADFGATRLFDASAAAAAPAPAIERTSGPVPATRIFQQPGAPAPAASTQTRQAPAFEPEIESVPAAEPRKKSPVTMIGIAAAALVVVGIVLYIALRPKQPTPATTATAQPATTEPASPPPSTTPIAPPPVLPPASATGSVTVETNQPGDLFVDGQKQGTVSGKQKIDLPVGKHTLMVSAPNFQASPKTVDVKKGKDIAARFTLSEVKVVEANPYVSISGTPGATVSVDGVPKSALDGGGKSRFQVEPGSHRVEVALNGYRPYSNTINAKARENVSLDAHLAAVPKPAISSFSASDNSIPQGKSTQLHWQTQNATEVDIQPGFPHQGGSGSISISPNSTTTYRITARGEGGSVEGSAVTINVSAPPAVAAKPVIAVFKAVPDHVPAGQGTTLAWVVQNAESLSIDQGVGSVSGDSRDVKPAKSTTYTLTATGPGGSITRSVPVTVEAAAAPPPVPIAENPDVRAIKAQVTAYKEAYESLSVDAMAKVRPLSKDERQILNDTFKQFRALKVNYSCDDNPNNPGIHGDSAQYVCAQSTTFTQMNGKLKQGDGNGSKVMFMLKRNGGAWAITDLKGTK